MKKDVRRVSHWNSLASQLGLEVRPEPEPEPVAAPEPEPSIADVVPAAPESPEPIPLAAEVGADLWDRGAEVAEETAADREPAVAERWPGDSVAEDDRFDRPGVLDEIFDGEEELPEPLPATPLPEFERDRAPREPEPENRRPLEEGGDPAGRRRRRRRGRRGRRVADESVADARPSVREMDFGEPESEEDFAPPTDFDAEPLEDESEGPEDLLLDEEPPVDADGETRQKSRRRRRRRRGPREERREPVEIAPPAPAPVPVAEVDEHDQFEEEADLDDDDDDASVTLKHPKLPTWEEAIGIVIAVNQEARAKNPGGGHRGRGGRGRK